MKEENSTMAKKELSNRNNWQTKSGKIALDSEEIFFNIFKEKFNESEYNYLEIIKKPENFKTIYNEVVLDEKTKSQIYNVDPNSIKKKWGFVPDFAIRNKKSNKILFIEIKNQDGWVEGGMPKDGRGNAHERSCKYFTPGLKKIIQKESKIDEKYHPIWLVFTGNITRDPKRNREIATWYDGIEDNYFMWRDLNDKLSIFNHFTLKLSDFIK